MTLVERLQKALTIEIEGEQFLLRQSKDAEAQRLLDLIWSYINAVGLPKVAATQQAPQVKREAPPVVTKEVRL